MMERVYVLSPSLSRQPFGVNEILNLELFTLTQRRTLFYLQDPTYNVEHAGKIPCSVIILVEDDDFFFVLIPDDAVD